MSDSWEYKPSLRRFLSRGEALTLVGMLLAVISLFLVWKETNAADIVNVPIPNVIQLVTTQRGLDLSVRWPLLLCATGACATLLMLQTAQNRLTLLVLQLTFSIAVCVMALTYFAPRPGVIMALIGGGLLIFGAIDRCNAGNNSSSVS